MSMHLLTPFFCATELALTVALVVFIMLTVLLTAIILLLCISKSFRVFFFRENRHADNTDKPNDATPIPDANTASETSVSAAATEDDPPTKPKQPRRKKSDDIFGGIPTVPLTLIGEAPAQQNTGSKQPRRKKSADDIATVEIPPIAATREPTVYTPRTVTNNRGDARKPQQAADGTKTATRRPKNK